jgi:hypothetical protein
MAASLGEVAASSGNKMWQDRGNNVVWFKFQGGMAYPNVGNLVPSSDEAVYRPTSVVLQGG